MKRTCGFLAVVLCSGCSDLVSDASTWRRVRENLPLGSAMQLPPGKYVARIRALGLTTDRFVELRDIDSQVQIPVP